MTMAELAAEICSRAGEGYQNYVSRAISHFRSAAISLIDTVRQIESEAPGLYAVGTVGVANDTPSLNVSAILTAAGMTIGTVKSLRYGVSNLASLITELENDNDIKYTAKSYIDNGNLIGVEYVVSAVPNSPLDISVEEVQRTVSGETVTGYKIVVTPATDESGVRITTATELVYWWETFPGNFYASVDIAPGNDGSGLIEAMSEQMLTGGSGVSEYLPLERITKQQFEASRLRPDILQSRDRVNFYTLAGQSPGGAIITLVAPPPLNSKGTIEYSVVGWRSMLENLAINVEPYFSPGYLERATAMAAEMLRREIQA